MDVSFTNVLEGARQYFQGLPSASVAAGPYYQQNVQQEQQSNHQQQHNQQQHQAYYQPQNHERYGNTAASTPVSTGGPSQWIQQQSPTETRPPTRENTPIQRSASRSSSGSRPPSHPSQYQDASRLYQNPYQQQSQSQEPQMPTHTSQANFQFSRPQARDVPTSHQYQMQQTYHQPSSPQISRPASREQVTPSRQTYQLPQSSGHSLPAQNTYSYQPRAYYSAAQAQTSEAKTVSSSVTSQSYYTSQPNPNTYQQPEIRSSSLNTQNDGQYQQNFRATHNLPPIAGLSNYRPSKNTKDSRTATLPRPKIVPPNTYLPSAQQQHVPAPSSSANVYPYVSNPSYTMYNNTLNQNNSQRSRPEISTVITQSYTNVIVTSHYSNVGSNQNRTYQRAEAQTVPKIQSANQNINYPKQHEGITYEPQSTSVIKQRKESPLDLSVKTVRTSADSTEQDASRKYPTNKPQSVVSSHSYPTLDINNSIQRSFTQRSQLPTATAPKVEFHPKFNLSSKHSSWTPVPKNIEDPVAVKNVIQATAAHANTSINKYQGGYQYYPTTAPTKENDLNGGSNSLPYQNRDYAPKRPAQIESPMIPSKIPRVDNWRESINLQIEQKFTSHYKLQEIQSQHKPPFVQQNIPYSKVNSPTTINGNYSHYDAPSIPSIPPQNQQLYAPSKPNQIYVPSAASQPYPGYFNPASKQQMYTNPVAKHYTQLGKSNVTGADKRVLSLLRNSIEIKEQKKIEQLKSNEVSTIQRTDIQHPSTDVTAPLQPKPGIDRNNVSPFTPISVPDPNICKMPPKMSYSVEAQHINQPMPILNKAPSDERTVIMNHNPGADYDGLAAFLAARIRTKGELKEVVHSQAVNNNADRDARLHAFLEDTIKSPNIQNMNVTSLNTSSTGLHTTPPKLFKDKQNVFPPRKKLFSRNEDDCKQPLPGRVKSNMRSSSETSIFDFNDSDDENEMPVLERQSLGAMRKDKRNSLRQSSTSLHNLDLDIKAEISEVPPRLPTPEDDLFGSICDKFMEQLKNKSTKRIRRILRPAEIKAEPVEKSERVNIKIEMIDDEFEEAACDVKVDEKPAEKLDINITPKNEKEISDSEMSDSEIKISKNLVARKRDAVRRRIVSSSDHDKNSVSVKIEPDPTAAEALQENKATENNEVVEVKCELLEKEADKTEASNELIKSEQEKVESEKPEEEKVDKPVDILALVRPAKKPAFGDGSHFYPGWEEGLYKYKKSLRMPPSLIQLTQPPYRLSTSLPDLDPCPQSPSYSIITDVDTKDSIPDNRKNIKRFKSEPLDSDSESTTSSFNIFNKKTNYDSEESASIRSLPNTRKENKSILDKLLEKCGGKKKRKYNRKEDHSPKAIAKAAESPATLLPTPTPSLVLSNKSPEKSKGLTQPVISAASAVLPFRKDTVNNFKDAFINSGNNILGVHDKFTTIVLSSRTRKETRALKQRATIKEVFGEDRPASAPPGSCVDQNKAEREQENISPFSRNLEEILIKKEKVTLEDIKGSGEALIKGDEPIKADILAAPSIVLIKQEMEDEDDEENLKLSELIVKKDPDAFSETLSTISLDDEDPVLSGKKKNKFGKMRRKFSSGFDYIRKKKKIKKEELEEKKEKKKKITPAKAPESIDDIQKEIKSWVLNKGVGESHLHRAARLGYADITAYCLEKLANPPSPKDNAGYTPLHEACSRGHLEIAKLLLKYGANVHESAKGGVRPLHEAIENGFVEIVRLLLSYGADPHLATYAGVTPLNLASGEITKNLFNGHLNDKAGLGGTPWPFCGPASCFDPEESGYDVLQDVPEEDSDKELEDIEIEMSDALLPNLYTIVGEPPTDRWVLLQDLSHFLKLKSRDALLKQLSPGSSSSSAKTNYKNVIKELKMSEFLEQAHCCQFLNMGEKINIRASKIALVKYSDRVRELLGIENAVIAAR